MSKPREVSQELKGQVASLVESYPKSAEAEVVLRGLYRLYFDSKPTADWQTKEFLLLEGFRFSSASETPYADDRVIFDEEASRHYQQTAKAGSGPQK